MRNFRRFAAFRDLHEAPTSRRSAKLVTADGQDLSARHQSMVSDDQPAAQPQAQVAPQAQPAPAAIPVASPAVTARPVAAPAAQPAQAQPQRKFVEPTETLPSADQDGLMKDRQGRPLPNLPMLTSQLSSRIQQYVDSYIEANPHLNELDPARLTQGIMAGRAWKAFMQAIDTHLKTLNPAKKFQPGSLAQELAPMVQKHVVNSQKHNAMRSAQAAERQKAQAATAARMQQPQQPAAQPASQGGGLWGGLKKAFGI